MATTIGLSCPDCNFPCPVAFALLTDDMRIVYLSSCPQCADGATVRCYKPIPLRTFAEAAQAGLPIVSYQKKEE